MLILNLALADFLMGIYLIMLGIAGVVFDGIFCRHELDWRSGAVADLGGGMGGMHPPHQPKSNDFGRKISLYFE